MSHSGARREGRTRFRGGKRGASVWRPRLSRPFAIAAIAACALIWGTTWYAITLQLGPVDSVVSIVWRFGLASVVLFGFCAATRRPLGLTRPQHMAAIGQGAFVFAVS